MSLADVPGTAIGLEIGLGLAAAVVAHRVAVSRQNARIREGYPLLDSAWRAMTRRTRVRAARSIRRGNPNLDARSAAGLAAVLLSLRAREAASGTSNTRVVIKSFTPLLFVSALALLAVLTGDVIVPLMGIAVASTTLALVGYATLISILRRTLPQRLEESRVRIEAALESDSRAGAERLATAPSARARPESSASETAGPLGSWLPLVVFGAAAFFVAYWGDNRAQDAELARALPADLRLPHSMSVSIDPLGAVFEHLSSFLTADGSNLSQVLDRATPGERMTYVLEDVDEEIGNGGFEQLYWNSDGALVPAAIRYAQALGASSYARALQVSTTVFPDGVVPARQSDRQRIIGPFESPRPALTKAGDLWPERSYAPALRAYVRAHPTEFFR